MVQIQDTKPILNNDEAIVIKGARVHNLKGVSLTIPRDKLIVITGPSGSGKSSLAFDTIYAEGQRRYIESLSVYARQFLDQMSKPDCDSIEGLSPTISIEQRTTSYNPRSTVGTVTEIHDYLRLLYARVSKPFCYKCGDAIQSQSPGQMVDRIMALEEGAKIAILAPMVRGRKGEYQKELHDLRQRGFVRVRIDGEIKDLSEEIRLDRNKKHDIEVFIDRLIFKGDRTPLATRVSESVDLALKLGNGQLILVDFNKNTQSLMSENFSCLRCKISYPPPEPRTFSFNSPMGQCPHCEGIGLDPSHSDEANEDTSDDDEVDQVALFRSTHQVQPPCPKCNGQRLRQESLSYKFQNKNIAELSSLPLSQVESFFKTLTLTPREQRVCERILKEIIARCEFLIQVGVEYLSLNRSAQSLSGGEAQRIRLATQIGSALIGVIYVLDEPSIGLHSRDNMRLLKTLEKLRDMGNTVIVVEHDRETMEHADHIVDLGPGAGTEGGHLVAEGDFATICKTSNGMTAQYLSGRKSIEIPKTRRDPKDGAILKLVQASEHNLKDLTVSLPLGTLITVTGVSGSGKSTLILDTLFPALLAHFNKNKMGPEVLPKLKLASIEGLEHLDKVIDIDQSAIGKTPRSNPATYTGVFTHIRDLFSSLPESKVRGFKPGRFSFNVKGGRCDTCEGDGVTKVEMHFLADVYVKCDVCRGKRYNKDTLDILYKGKNIAQVLEMTAAEAVVFFDAVPWIKSRLSLLNDVGLGYLTLGQSSTTLSGGEAQRIKLTRELSKRDTGRTLYILDEPSTGLHFEDIRKLIDILQTLVNRGNTVIVIEHNLDIIKVSDHLLDLGPEGGERGGQIVAQGTPEQVAKVKGSYTGQFLKSELSR